MVERYRPNKYRCWHDAIIKRAKARDASSLAYVERHHIKPRCLGGDNAKSNIAILTPEEHYVVHQLLAKLYPENKSLAHACVMMTGNATPGRRNKLYGWLRRAHAKAVSEFMTGKQYALGIRFSRPPEFGEITRKRMMGNQYCKGCKQPPRSETARNHHSEMMNNPEIKASHRKAVKEAMARPEVQIAQSEGVRLWWEQRTEFLPSKRRIEIARNAALARWEKVKRAGAPQPNPKLQRDDGDDEEAA